jgi:hypothetical protein
MAVKTLKLSENDGIHNQRVIADEIKRAAGKPLTLQFEAGNFPITPVRDGNHWVGLNLGSNLTLTGKPTPQGRPPTTQFFLDKNFNGANPATDAIYLARSNKAGNNSNLTIKDMGLDATSNRYATNALYLGAANNKIDKADSNVSLENLNLRGGSGDYRGSVGAGYALDVLNVRGMNIKNVAVHDSRYGAIFKGPTDLSIDGLHGKNLNPPTSNPLTGNKHLFGIKFMDTKVTSAKDISIDGFNPTHKPNPATRTSGNYALVTENSTLPSTAVKITGTPNANQMANKDGNAIQIVTDKPAPNKKTPAP